MPPVDARPKLALAERVGLELRRHGMLKHVGHLRRYYATVRAGRTPASGEWDEQMVIEWAKILRIAPHEGAYPVRPRMSKCGCASPKTYTRCVWPEGAVSVCSACHEVWLELG
jgi:hypothetical protein